MSEIINKDGVDVEVFTPEEVEAQKEEARLEAIEAYKAENPDKSGELEKLNKELEGFKSKDLNFGNLRKQKEDAEKKVADILAGVDEKINSVKKDVLEGVMKDHREETLNSLTGGDEELKKKVEYHYNRLGDVASTKSEINKKLNDAYLLATGGTSEDISTNVFSSGGVGKLKTKVSETKLTPEEKAIGAKFGLKDEDFKRVGQ